MGFELRNIQRKFNHLMGEVQPQIRPRFVVWLDERLAEFKIKGEMNLSETLDDPQWIKEYNKSKREARSAAIKERSSMRSSTGDGVRTGPSEQVKVEVRSESSNGLPPEDIELSDRIDTKDDTTAPQGPDQSTNFQLVEVKTEQIAEEEDDDMIIVGESIASSTPQSAPQAYSSQYMTYNPSRQLYGGFPKQGLFQRKRQRFGAHPFRPGVLSAMSARSRQRIRPNFRSPQSSDMSTSQPSFTSQSLPYGSSQMRIPTHTITHSYGGEEETLRIPPHLQSEAGLQLSSDPGDASNYAISVRGAEGEEMMYSTGADVGDDDSYIEGDSYLTEPGGQQSSQSSLIQYDDSGADTDLIKGEESLLEPMPGTSTDDPSTQDYEIELKSTKKRSYNGAFKIRVIERSKSFGIRPTAREFNIPEVCVRQWRQAETRIRQQPSGKLKYVSKPRPRFPLLEEELINWLKCQRETGRPKSFKQAQAKVLQLAHLYKVDGFAGSASWYSNVLKRNKMKLK